jgi:hypothetical protein
MTNSSNKRFSLSQTMFTHVQYLRRVAERHGISAATTDGGRAIPFTNLQNMAQEAGMSGVPGWIRTDRKVRRGVYSLPELFADDANIDIFTVKRGRPAGSPTKASAVKTAKPEPKPVAVAAPAPMPTPVVQTAECVEADLQTVALARSVSGGERDTFIPDSEENYVPWGYHNEITKIIKSGRFCPVFITGLSGNGKTTMVEQVCAGLKRECVRVNFTAATDEDELLGGFRLIGGETKFVPGPVLVAMERGAVLLLDEIDLGGHLIMCLQSVLEGKGKFIPKIGKYVRPAPGFTVIATANTKGKGSDDGRFAGTNILNEAFLDRFAFTYEQDYADQKVECRILEKYGASIGVSDKEFIANLVSWADIIRKSFAQQVVSEIVTTRRLRDILFAYSVFGDKMTAIERCVARFDATTKDSFMQFYTKVDADARTPKAAPKAEGVTDSSTCPF